MPVASVSYISRDTATLEKSNAMVLVPTTDTNNINNPKFIPSIRTYPTPLANWVWTYRMRSSRNRLRDLHRGLPELRGSRPLTYVSSSERTMERQPSMSSAPSLQRAVASTAASKVKKALGLKSSKKVSQQNSVSSKRAVTIGELMRVQMRISEQIDSRVRRALLRISAGQLGKHIESLVLPLELLQQFKSSDFPTQREYEAWQKEI